MPPHGHSTSSHISHTTSRPMTTHRSTSSISRSTSSHRSTSSSISRSTSTHTTSSSISSHSTSTHAAPSTHSTSTHTTSKPTTTTKPYTNTTLKPNYKSASHYHTTNNYTIIQTGGDHSNQYSNIEINNSYEKTTDPDKIKKVKCPYCDSKFEYNESKIDDITELKCPNCGAKLEKEDIDVSVAPKKNILRPPTDYSDRYSSTTKNNNKKSKKEDIRFLILIAIASIAIGSMMIIAIALALSKYNSNIDSDVIVNDTDNTIINNTDTVKEQQEENSLYVSEIGRTCYLLEDGNYYDPVTDCYFWYNTDVYPNTWQYWYEGISSDYGDYGWMEYDESEGLWYIQVSEYDWIVLPNEYYTSYLWYIQ